MRRGGAHAPGPTVDAGGWLRWEAHPVARAASPNHDARPVDVAPTLIVVHGISLPPGRFGGREIDALFTNTLDYAADPYFDALRTLRVSSHFLVRRDGEVVQFVGCDARAWHAGASAFEGRERCNDYSIGIELEGADDRPYEDAQYRRLVPMIDALTSRYPIDAIAAHSDIAPGRKTDPGPCFDWPRVLSRLAQPLRKAAAPPD